MRNWSSQIYEWLKSGPDIQWATLPNELMVHLQATSVFDDLSKLPLSQLLQSLAHRSFVHELKRYGTLDSNERLEFLGDSVLSLLVSSELYQRFPDESEGVLSKRRGALVNQDFLAEIAEVAGLPQLILLGNSEWGRSHFLFPSLLSDVLEATLGAIYCQLGADVARAYLTHLWSLYLQKTGKDPFKSLAHFDPKSQLQEKSMALVGQFPEYLSREIAGPNGPCFEVQLQLIGEVLLTGQFDSKKRGTRHLAKQALELNLVETLLARTSLPNNKFVTGENYVD